METLREAVKYLDGPDNVADFQKFCGVEVYTKTESNGCVVSDEAESNGVVPRHGTSNMPAELKHRVNTNGYSKLGNGYISGITKTDLLKNGLNNKNGFVKNEYSTHNGVANHNTQDSTSQTKLYYKIRYKPLHYLFHLGASLGNEIFYLVFFPFVMWNLDSSLLRETAIVWHAGMYLGQALKDIIRRPRPTSPPAIPLEDRYAKEYGMPSTHAMVGAIIPFSLFIISAGTYQVKQISSISIFSPAHVKYYLHAMT